MLWKCPACQIEIRHTGTLPLLNIRYRCHACRVELVFDQHAQRLIVVPNEEPTPRPKQRNTKG